MKTQEEKEINKGLVGAVVQAPLGSYIADMTILKEPLVKETSVIHGFCTNCGAYPEYSKDGTITLTGKDFDENVDYKNKYLSTDYCLNCYVPEEKLPVIALILPIE